MPKSTDEEGKDYDWNDQISSIRVVRGTWMLFENGRANTKLDDSALEELDITEKTPVGGWSALVSASSVGPVEYCSSESGSWGNDTISSIILISPDPLPARAIYSPRVQPR